MQLEAIERADAAGKALVADVKAKILDASPVDHLWFVKARSRRRAPLAVRGCPLGIPERPARGSTRVPLSTVEHSSARGSTRVPLEYSRTPGVLAYPWYALLSTREYAGVLLMCRRVPWHRIVLLRAQQAAAVATVEYLGTVEYPEYG